MDNCRMNYYASRSCRIQPREVRGGDSCYRNQGNRCSDKIEDTDIYRHVDHLPLAMAYVPMQRFENTFNLCKALQVGTIFPELCKPFCGKRGGGR